MTKPSVRVERTLRRLREVADVLPKFTPKDLADLERRGAATASRDGFSSGAIGGGVTSQSESTSVELAALDPRHVFVPATLPPRKHTRCQTCGEERDHRIEDAEGSISVHALDPVGEMLGELFQNLADIWRLTIRADTLRERIIHAGDGRYGRQDDLGGPCQACGRFVEGTPVDRLRSGYCERDHRRWTRAGKPDRLGFEMQVRAGDFDGDGIEVQRV